MATGEASLDAPRPRPRIDLLLQLGTAAVTLLAAAIVLFFVLQSRQQILT